MSYTAPLDLVPALRRVRARAHAARIPEAPAPARTLPVAEQLLHDAATVGATIAHGGTQVKADGDLYAKALPSWPRRCLRCPGSTSASIGPNSR